MSTIEIGRERWELIGNEGSATKLPPETVANVSFPATWRVFGPVAGDNTTIDWARKENYMWYKEAIPAKDAAVEDLHAVPDSLKVGDESFQGREISMDGDTLDLSSNFGGHEAGQQAYGIAEMDVDEETEVIFGAGCDWWMQWWIDGEVVCDTLERGNRTGFPWPKESANSIIKRTDHCFRRTLSPGKHLIIFRAISGQTDWVLRAGLVSPRDELFYSLPYSNKWEFLPDLDEIRPPAKDYWTHTMAIRSDLCIAEETLECDFQQNEHSGNFGLIFGAQDNGHYYWAQIPDWGQLFRARAFYAAISIADGTGYYRNLKMELMPNVPVHRDSWRSLKVERRGNRIQMWVNGVKGPSVIDETYGAGRVGVAGFSRYQIRNLKIDGKAAEAGTWVKEDRRGRPWMEPQPAEDSGECHWPWRITRFSDDEIILPIGILRDDYSVHRKSDDNSALYLYNSVDAGRSWTQYAGPFAQDDVPHEHWFVPEDGIIRNMRFDSENRCMQLLDSHDKGVTWNEAGRGELIGDWEREIFQEGTQNGPSGTHELKDGTLLMKLTHQYPHLRTPVPNASEGTWATGLYQAYCTTSTDKGFSWSEPAPMDHATNNLLDVPHSPMGDFTETTMAELPDGRVIAMSRPNRSPFMWQTYSEDHGQTWGIACYAPFSGHGGPELLVTQSGYLVLVKRGPGLGMNISLDGGLNWDEGTMVDFSTAFNGSILEVEPDVVLVIYRHAFDEIRPAPARTQRILITPDGPVPLGND